MRPALWAPRIQLSAGSRRALAQGCLRRPTLAGEPRVRVHVTKVDARFTGRAEDPSGEPKVEAVPPRASQGERAPHRRSGGPSQLQEATADHRPSRPAPRRPPCSGHPRSQASRVSTWAPTHQGQPVHGGHQRRHTPEMQELAGHAAHAAGPQVGRPSPALGKPRGPNVPSPERGAGEARRELGENGWTAGSQRAGLRVYGERVGGTRPGRLTHHHRAPHPAPDPGTLREGRAVAPSAPCQPLAVSPLSHPASRWSSLLPPLHSCVCGCA